MLVFVSDASPASKKKLEDYLQKVWPAIEKSGGIMEGASIANYEVLSRGDDLVHRFKECEFEQEVCYGRLFALWLLLLLAS